MVEEGEGANEHQAEGKKVGEVGVQLGVSSGPTSTHIITSVTNLFTSLMS